MLPCLSLIVGLLDFRDEPIPFPTPVTLDAHQELEN